MIKKNILIIFVDPGGGQAVSEVAERLNLNPEYHLINYCGKLSNKIAQKAGLKYKIISEMINIHDAEEIFKEAAPDIILTSTGGGNTEQVFRNIAYREDIPSVVILDFWKDYERRWLYSDHDILELKDIICVMDDLTKKEMTDAGFPEKNIRVTGHPYLDKIFNRKRNEFENTKGNLINILFLSQPLEIIGIKEYKIHPLKNLMNAVLDYSENSEKEITVKIKLHPSEIMSNELSEIICNWKFKRVSMFIARNRTLNELIEESDLIFGYNSIALFDARSRGKRVVSLNLFPMKDSLKKAFSDADIESADVDKDNLTDILRKGKEIYSSKNVFRGGTENCIKVILDELRLKENAN